MTKRIPKLMMAVAALGAMALGGTALAQAQSSPAPPPAAEKVVTPDRDNIQSGDQTIPDTPAAGSKARSTYHAVRHVAAESAANSDGPGGHADTTGANVDHQFQGTE